MDIFSALFDDKPKSPSARHDTFENAAASYDGEGRRWPKPLTIPRDRIRELEGAIAKLSTELTLRCAQVADLYNIRQQQEAELLNSCDEIDQLGKVIEEIQRKLVWCESDAAVENHKLVLLASENNALRLQLENVQREVALANQQHQNELNQLSDKFNGQIRIFEETAIERNKDLENLEASRAKLTTRIHDLTIMVDSFECDKKHSREKFIGHAVETFETILMVERKSAESKIRELTDELRRERLNHSTAVCASGPTRKDIVIPFSRRFPQQSQPISSEHDKSHTTQKCG
jgi:chromosome segregation ATPase